MRKLRISLPISTTKGSKETLGQWIIRLAITLVFMVVCAYIVSTLPSEAFGSPVTITYEGQGDFSFADGEKAITTNDVFSEFSNVMPGDKCAQEITFINDNPQGKQAYVYLQAFPTLASSGTQAFLDELKLTLSSQEKSDDQDLTEGIYVGCADQGESLNFRINLEVPQEIGNEYQQAQGNVDWLLRVEEREGSSVLPQAGDIPSFLLWMGGMVVIATVLLLLKRRFAKRF